MQFSEMVQWVIRDSKRPDKINEIKDAINAAIETFSLSASFANDLVETTISITNTVYAQSFDVTDEFTRFRKMKYMKRPGQKGYIKWIDSQNVFMNDGCEQLDRWYRAGNNIVFKMKVLSATLDVGYYQYPPRMTEDEDEHWMLEVMPTAVHDKAMERILDVIGETQESQRMGKLAEKAFIVAREDFEDSAEIRSEA